MWQQLALVATTYGIESGDLSGFERATAAVAQAEALDPDAFETHLAQASLTLTLHRFTEAAEHAQAAVYRNRYSADALAMLVDAQVELGHYDDAASILQQMLDLDPGLPALARTSYLRELHGDLPGALQAMQQAETASAPSGYRTAVVATLAGGLHLRLGQMPAATAAYERAEKAAPGFEPALLGSVNLQAASGDVNGAIRRLTDIDGPGAAAATLLGNLLRLQGRDAEARAADQLVRANFADEEKVGHVTDLDLATFEADRTDDPQRAIDLARIAYEIRPQNVAANDTLGWALTRAARTTEAIPFIEAALRLGSTDPASQVHAAAAYLAVDDPIAAAHHLRIALDQPWTAFILQPEVERLAAALDVPLPSGWVHTA